jgi:hypothetical protein
MVVAAELKSGRWRRACGGALGVQPVQLGSLHSASRFSRGTRASVGRRELDGRCFDETDALREMETGLWRGLLSVLCCLDSAPTVGRRGFVAGALWETTGVGAGGRTGGLRELGAESAELFDALLKLEYPESLRRSMLAGIGFSGAGELRSLDRFVLTLAWAEGDDWRGRFPLSTWPSLSSDSQSSTIGAW